MGGNYGSGRVVLCAVGRTVTERTGCFIYVRPTPLRVILHKNDRLFCVLNSTFVVNIMLTDNNF
ncbi:hypothetical protein [Sicyoidochytrium minutum DNA virus]|nr:hypothetical protein [Sicyoidochytrium minutum DNA virus]